jgi:hypothetical protein
VSQLLNTPIRHRVGEIVVIGTKNFVFPLGRDFGVVDLSAVLASWAKNQLHRVATHLDMPVGFICYAIHELKHLEFAKRRHRHPKPEKLV